jgi:hypothetical protein
MSNAPVYDEYGSDGEVLPPRDRHDSPPPVPVPAENQNKGKRKWEGICTKEDLGSLVNVLETVVPTMPNVKVNGPITQNERDCVMSCLLEEIQNNVGKYVETKEGLRMLDGLLIIDGIISLLANKSIGELKRMISLPHFHTRLCSTAYAFAVCLPTIIYDEKKPKECQQKVTRADIEMAKFFSGFGQTAPNLRSFASVFFDEHVRLVLWGVECDIPLLKKVLMLSNAQAMETSFNYVGKEDEFTLKHRTNAYVAWLGILKKKVEPVCPLMLKLQHALGISEWIHSNHKIILLMYETWENMMLLQ